MALAVRKAWARFPTKPRPINVTITRLHSVLSTHAGIRQHRASLSKIFLPTSGLAEAENEDSHAKLIRAGFLRQSHAGIFHMLPLGQRVQEKLERLIDKYMQQVGASKISLSSISSQALWEKTGRLEGYGPELFRLNDRKDTPYLLAPTHEEEITHLVAKSVKSYKELPLRVYQIGRKYRDELRPRQGVLRSREFLMKDLYTFDPTVESALETYGEVRAAYSRLFDELKIPYLVAEASSGDIGGDLSHEYHLPAPVGEDHVISCNNCSYVANEELAVAKVNLPELLSSQQENDANKVKHKIQSLQIWRGVSKDRSTLVNVWYPASPEFSEMSINTHAVKAIVPDVDTSVEDPLSLWRRNMAEVGEEDSKVVNLVDARLTSASVEHLTVHYPSKLFSSDTGMSGEEGLHTAQLSVQWISRSPDDKPLNFLRISDGDDCDRCSSGKLKIQRAVELGHTFHLGTRYSEPLGAQVQLRDQTSVPVQMGCHGIGVSRIIGAVADHLADEKGLNWPRAIAPFEVIIIPGKQAADSNVVYDHLVQCASNANALPAGFLDVVLDDRPESFGFKMKDADLVGYPVIVLLGRKWQSERACEVQCRRLRIKTNVSFEELPMYISNLLSKL